MLRRLHTGGLNTLDLILNASKARLMQIPGIGPKKSEQYYNDIRNVISKAKLYRLMIASNCFPAGMGKTLIKQITDVIPDVMAVPFEEKFDRAQLFTRLTRISGIGKVRADSFIEGLKKFKEFIKSYPEVEQNNIKFVQQLQKCGYNNKICRKTFVFTNLEDDDLEDYITDHKGCLSKQVNLDVEAVVTGNICAMSTKQLEASRVGIRVYTLQEFKQCFAITY
jgi:NAD-dependent DNA ligase